MRAFESRYTSTIKRARSSRQLKSLNIKTFQVCGIADAETFRQFVGEIERLDSLERYEDQFNHALCGALWSLIEAQDCALRAQAKRGIEEQFTTVF